jgi:cell division protein FtsN
MHRSRQSDEAFAPESALKLVFLLLIAINLALYAWQRGAFGTLPESGREPERVARQVEPERIRVLTPEQTKGLREAARAAAPRSAANGPLDVAVGAPCVEFGDFSEAQAGRVRPRLDVLGLSDRLEVRSVEAAGWYMVYVPPFKTRAEADRAAEQLRDLGVREFLVIGDNSPMRFGIALGSFRDQDLANRHLADLQKRGVKAARVADKASTVTATRYVIRPVDPVLAAALQELQREFNAGRLVVCGEAS